MIKVTPKAPVIENNVMTDFPNKKNSEICIEDKSIVAIATNKLAPLLTPNT